MGFEAAMSSGVPRGRAAGGRGGGIGAVGGVDEGRRTQRVCRYQWCLGGEWRGLFLIKKVRLHGLCFVVFRCVVNSSAPPCGHGRPPLLGQAGRPGGATAPARRARGAVVAARIRSGTTAPTGPPSPGLPFFSPPTVEIDSSNKFFM